MIDVIIPAYNSLDTIEYTLSSIAYQSISSLLNVYVVNDCSDYNYQNIIDFFSSFINIKELQLNKNGGPAVARQYGIDNSYSPYIVFIDSDDVFANCKSLENLYNGFKVGDYDIVMSPFLEEISENFIEHEPAYVWLHGKMFSRKFLNDNCISFNTSRFNEDCGFNQLCYLCDAKYYELDDATYIWKNNRNSITRSQDNYNQNNSDSYLFNMIWSLKESLNRNYNYYRVAINVFITFVSAYHYYLQTNNNIIIKMLGDIVDYLDEFSLTDDTKFLIIRSQLMSDFYGSNTYCLYNPSITLEQFITIVREEVGK